MAIQTFADIEQIGRDYSQDNDSNTGNYAITSTVAGRIINRLYMQHKALVDTRVTEMDATTSGLSYAAGIITALTTPTNIRQILHAYQIGSAAPSVFSAGILRELEHVKMHEYDDWRRFFAGVSPVISIVAAERIATGTAASVGKWRVNVWPACDTPATTYVGLRCQLEPTALSGGTDKPDVSDDESYGLGVLLGAWIAKRIGKPPEFVAGILDDLPDTMHATAEQARLIRRPMRRQDEDAA